LDILRKRTWLAIFALCFIYWVYLIFHTKMAVIFDASEYESAGRLIYQNGWIDFFKTGPHREPLYPALIAFSMGWANFFSTDYQIILKVFQVALLLFTQSLLFLLLRKLKLREGVNMVAVLYYGISPALINATFSLFGEIIVFPWVVAVVLLSDSLWSDIGQKGKHGFFLAKAVLLGACFSLLVFGRGIFLYVFSFFMLPFCLWVFLALYKRRGLILLRLLLLLSAASLTFYSLSAQIKVMNLRYNGEYGLGASRLDILLGSAYKRSQPVNWRIVASHIASIPGNGVCRMFFSQQECDYADWYGSDQFRVTEVARRIEAIPKARRGQEILILTAGKITGHPFQFCFFSVVEALKMPFWESTQIAYVTYPEFLTKVYDNPLIRFGLRFFFGLVSAFSFIFVTFKLWRKRGECFMAKEGQRDTSLLFFVWLMITAYTLSYSSCYVVTRYALPIVSMFVICICFTVNEIIKPGKLNRRG